MKVKHVVIFLSIAAGVGLLTLFFFAVRGAEQRAAANEEYEREHSTVYPEDTAMIAKLRERTDTLRKGREKFATRAALEAAVPDPKHTCEHQVPQLELHPARMTMEGATLAGTALNPTDIKFPRDVLVPVIPVDNKIGKLHTRGLVEAMEAVIERLGNPTLEPASRPARTDGAALLALPAHEVMFLVEEVRNPKVDFADGGEAPTSFTMGSVRGRAVLVDHDSGKILCAAEISAENSEVVNFSYQVEQYGSLSIPTGSPSVRAMGAAYEDLWRQLAAAVGERRLQALTPAKSASTRRR